MATVSRPGRNEAAAFTVAGGPAHQRERAFGPDSPGQVSAKMHGKPVRQSALFAPEDSDFTDCREIRHVKRLDDTSGLRGSNIGTLLGEGSRHAAPHR